MEKKRLPIRESFKPVKLYLEDINLLIDVFKDVNPEVSIETDLYIFSTLEELRSTGCKYLTDVTLTMNDPYVSLELKPYDVILYASNDTPLQRGIIEKLKIILLGRRRPLWWFMRQATLAGCVIGASFGSFLFGLWLDNVILALLGSLLLLIGLLWSRLVLFENRKKYSLIYLENRSESPGFWVRKRDEIIIAVIAATIGSIITLLITWLFQKVTSTK